MDTIERAPRGKRVLIGSETVEVWPFHCVDGHNCFNCYLTGMKGCAPRFWYYPPWRDSEAPSETRSSYRALASLSGTYIPMLRLDSVVLQSGETSGMLMPAQPLDPIEDGGFTEEITNQVISTPILRKSRSYRLVDHDCESCGYSYLAFYSKVKGHKDKYRCPRCGRFWTKDAQRLPEKAKILLYKLRDQGLSTSETIELIRQSFGIKITSNTYYSTLKRRGEYISRQGQRPKVKV